MQKNVENVRLNMSLNDIVRMSHMFNGHDACASGTGRAEENGSLPDSWRLA
jgi:hypothetical protein